MISVRLDEDKCKGCTTCVKQCPTEAIRVRLGRAIIIKERCIDCGHCVRACPNHAKIAVADPLSRMKDFALSIAMPAPSLYAQFHHLDDVNIVLQALIELGFDEVFEPAYAAQIVTELTAEAIKSKTLPKPVLSSACPAVQRLIMQRYPNLIAHILNCVAPVELAAKLARQRAVDRSGLPPQDIGIFFITPCPAKVSESHSPSGLSAPVIDYAVPMSEVYLKLLPIMKKVKNPPNLRQASGQGLRWAASGGESAPLEGIRCASVDGLSNVIDILEAVEDDKLPELEYLELNACTSGCVGGCLTVENPFAAGERLRRIASIADAETGEQSKPCLEFDPDEVRDMARRDRKLIYKPTTVMDTDFARAVEKMRQAEALKERLPGLDCGSCGTPGCHALAEDVVQGYAEESDCIFNVRARMSDSILDDSQYLPPPFRRRKDERDDTQ